MDTKVLNYRVIIEPEKTDSGRVYNAYCPTLGVADYGNSVEEVLKSIQDGIELAVEMKVKRGEEVSVDNLEEQLVTATKIKAPVGTRFALS